MVEEIKAAYKAMNGTKWIFWLSSALWFVVTTSIVFTGKAVYDNNYRATEAHILIMSNISAIDKRVAVIEGNRFTSKDAQAMMELMLNKLPPKWLTDSVNENKRDIKRIQNGAN